MNNGPFNVWPNMVIALTSDLRWLVENQAAIVKAWPAKPMPVARPIKVWPNGRVRVEFCGTFNSAKEAKAACEAKLMEAGR